MKTGDVSSAGSNANVYLVIYGAKGDTGQLMLRQSGSYKNKFERGKTDTFKIEATDIGQVFIKNVTFLTEYCLNVHQV